MIHHLHPDRAPLIFSAGHDPVSRRAALTRFAAIMALQAYLAVLSGGALAGILWLTDLRY